jgi:GDP-L-fucose synthase
MITFSGDLAGGLGRARVADRVLVTGGCGFLGTHLVRRLADDGYRVDVVDVEPPLSPIPGTFIHADLRAWLLFAEVEYSIVFHLAALVGGRRTIEYEPLAVAGNATLDQAVFEYMARVRHGRLVYMSSSAVYPIERQTELHATPLREAEVDLRRGPLGIPDLTYGWTKLSGEFTASLLAARHDLSTTIYRPFSVYGPGQSECYPVTAIVQRALQYQDPLVVWGSGMQCRDFVYIDDFLNIVMATFASQPSAVPLNIATGQGANFKEVARIAAGIMGYQPVIATDQRQPEGVLWRVGAVDSIPTELRPIVGLEEGLERLVKHLAGNL